MIVGALLAGPGGAAMYMHKLNMVASGAVEADPHVAAVITTAGAAAATAAPPYMSAVAPYTGAGAADLVILVALKNGRAGIVSAYRPGLND